MKITVIILTYNEELHIERCIRSAQLITDSIYVVDSNSSDSTIDIATSLGVRLLNRNFDSHSQQFNWALEAIDHCEWVIRMDADEYLTNELAVNIREAVELNSLVIHGYAFPRRIAFLGKLIRFGGVFPVEIVRMFRYGFGKIESRLMDEQILVSGKVVALKGELIDDNKSSLSWWIDKHNRYASLEALEMLSNGSVDEPSCQLSGKTAFRRKLKNNYYKLPVSIRALSLFIYRYVIRLGFRDGFYGFLFHFYQGFWYRLLVDSKYQALIDAGIGSITEDSVGIISRSLGLSESTVLSKLNFGKHV
jgi:glycosyltransferase involved in cell wall biosynthesis